MENQPQKPKIIMPLIALILAVVPLAVLLVINFFLINVGTGGWLILVCLLSMANGLVFGIMSLTKGKKKIGKIGMILSITAIVFAASPALFVIGFMIGVSTGLISLM